MGSPIRAFNEICPDAGTILPFISVGLVVHLLFYLSVRMITQLHIIVRFVVRIVLVGCMNQQPLQRACVQYST
jgi:hypothetical protein